MRIIRDRNAAATCQGSRLTASAEPFSVLCQTAARQLIMAVLPSLLHFSMVTPGLPVQSESHIFSELEATSIIIIIQIPGGFAGEKNKTQRS